MRLIIQLLIILLLSTVTLALSKDVYTQFKKFREISNIENKVQKSAEENKELEEKLEESKTEFSLEKEARSKLGYQKRGEVLYVVDLGGADKETTKKKENWQKWLDLFLH